MAATLDPPRPHLRSQPVPQTGGRHWYGVIAVIGAYTLLRLLLIPSDAHLTWGYSHDSGYLTIVAQNLLAGRGFVNDAHWLVFLHPASLPVPYHNANPLFPVLVAGLSWALPLDPFGAGFAISALASGLLVLALVVLLAPYLGGPWRALLPAFAGALFFPVFEDSLRYLTDALHLTLLVALAAAVVRRRVVLAGIFLGLAWLTRGQTVLVLPALLVYLAARHGWRPGIQHFATICLVAALLATPWLAHQYATWGDPLRSDSSYFLIQDLAAARFDGSLERYWHSTEEPPGALAFFRADPPGFTLHTLMGAATVAIRLLRHWAGGSVATLLFLAATSLLFLAGTLRGRPARLRSPELLSLVVYVAALLLVFGVRPESTEMRYLNSLSLMVAGIAALGCLRLWDAATAHPRGRLARGGAVLAALALLWGGLLLPRTGKSYAHMTSADVLWGGYQQLARTVHESYTRGRPVVVGTKPYLFTAATRAPALSIPESDDAYLLAYMQRYGAEYVFLLESELSFWRPDWAERPPEWLTPVATFAPQWREGAAASRPPAVPGAILLRLDPGRQ
ncbi:hypothetical protein BH24GEM3_BH24GEM3_12580 [soil metagenome]